MPRGTRHELVGTLLEQSGQTYLRCDDGGRWRLDMSRRASHLIGKRVRVEGLRDGFDLLAVERIGAAS